MGISTDAQHQCLFVDTPGLNSQFNKALNKVMNDTVLNVIKDVDVVLFVVERFIWNEADQYVLDALKYSKVPVLLVINKIDLVQDKEELLPHIAKLAQKREFAEIIPVSALGGHNLETVDKLVKDLLPEAQFLFPEDQVTDRSSRFLAAELIREKVTRQLGDELPYEVTVEIEKFEIIKSVLHIHGLILVDKKGQKRIVIGKDGERLKQIGSAAREDMETAFESKVMLLVSLSGRGELKTLTGLESSVGALRLQGQRLFSGMYINELLTRLLLSHVEHKQLYLAYQDTLAALQGKADLQLLLRQFELCLLSELGYGINLELDCQSQQPIEEGLSYHFTPDVGFQALSEKAQHNSDKVFLGSHILALREHDLADEEVVRTAKRLLRTALAAHLGGKPLNSRSLFVK